MKDLTRKMNELKRELHDSNETNDHLTIKMNHLMEESNRLNQELQRLQQQLREESDK